MKKILILLIGFAFTQSIQTKQVEVTITDMENFNLYGLIENPTGETYSVELSEAEYDGIIPDNSEFYALALNNIPTLGADEFSLIQLYFISESQSISIVNDSPLILSESNPSIEVIHFNLSNAFNLDDNPMTLKFWVTGMFEDAGVGLQGDMNDDDIINVVDIVALVNIVIGE